MASQPFEFDDMSQSRMLVSIQAMCFAHRFTSVNHKEVHPAESTIIIANASIHVNILEGSNHMPAISKQQVKYFGRIVCRYGSSILGQLTGHQELPCCLNRISTLTSC